MLDMVIRFAFVSLPISDHITPIRRKGRRKGEGTCSILFASAFCARWLDRGGGVVRKDGPTAGLPIVNGDSGIEGGGGEKERKGGGKEQTMD